MSLEEQQKWLQDVNLVDLRGDRIVDPSLRRKHGARFNKLMQLPIANEVIEVLRAYVQSSIPAIKRGEVSFWEISSFPGDVERLCARINISWQLVFDVLDNSPFSTIIVMYMTRSLAEQAFNISLSTVSDVTPLYLRLDDGYDLEFDILPSGLKKGGPNQVKIMVDGSENAHRLLHYPPFSSAIRQFNLNLIKRGPCPWGKSHCLDLADRLIEQNEEIDSKVAILQNGYGPRSMSYCFWIKFLERANKRTKMFKGISLSPVPQGNNRYCFHDLMMDSLDIIRDRVRWRDAEIQELEEATDGIAGRHRVERRRI